MLQIQNISKSFSKITEKKKILDDVSMTIKNNDKVALIGRSGCGKTTFLNIIAGLLSTDKGKIIYNDSILDCNSNSIERSKFRFNYIGIVPQRLCLINEYTVFDNIAYPLRLRGEKRIQLLDNKVKKVAARLEITDLLKEKAATLSTGQCQRIAIARAIITYPAILLADEPTSALDFETRSLVMKEFLEYPGMVIIVSHDSHVISSCQETFLLENGNILKI